MGRLWLIAGLRTGLSGGQKAAQGSVDLGWSFGWQHMAGTGQNLTTAIGQTGGHLLAEFHRCHAVGAGQDA